MVTMAEIQQLQDIMRRHGGPDLNYGGCAVVATLAGQVLTNLGVEVKLRPMTSWSAYDLRSVRAALRSQGHKPDAATVHDWDEAGSDFGHVVCEAQLSDGQCVIFDSSNAYVNSGWMRGGTMWSGVNCYDYRLAFGGGMTVAEGYSVSRHPQGWNPCFDREKHIPKLVAAFNQWCMQRGGAPLNLHFTL